MIVCLVFYSVRICDVADSLFIFNLMQVLFVLIQKYFINDENILIKCTNFNACSKCTHYYFLIHTNFIKCTFIYNALHKIHRSCIIIIDLQSILYKSIVINRIDLIMKIVIEWQSQRWISFGRSNYANDYIATWRPVWITAISQSLLSNKFIIKRLYNNWIY